MPKVILLSLTRAEIRIIVEACRSCPDVVVLNMPRPLTTAATEEMLLMPHIDEAIIERPLHPTPVRRLVPPRTSVPAAFVGASSMRRRWR